MADDTTPQSTGRAEGPDKPCDSAPPGPVPAGPVPSGPVPSDSALPPVTPSAPDTGYTPGGVPTLDGVREKIETRYGTALGATELAEDTPEARTAAQQFEARQHAAADKLEQIRESMHNKDAD